jgi:hypothetical protein
MLRILFGRFTRIIGTIHRAEVPVPSDAALEFFTRLLRHWFLQWIGATSGQNRARDAKGGREGFQVLIIIGLPVQCKNFGIESDLPKAKPQSRSGGLQPPTQINGGFKPPLLGINIEDE